MVLVRFFAVTVLVSILASLVVMWLNTVQEDDEAVFVLGLEAVFFLLVLVLLRLLASLFVMGKLTVLRVETVAGFVVGVEAVFFLVLVLLCLLASFYLMRLVGGQKGLALIEQASSHQQTWVIQ